MKTNKKALRVDLGKYKKPNPYKGDIIKDKKGQWKYPGLKTRIEGSDTGTDITMAGVPFPVVGTDNTGFSQMMYPNQDYRFPGKYVDETPMTKVGGVPELPLDKGRHAYKAWGYTMNDIIAENKKKKGGEKKYSRDMAATNKVLQENALFKKKKSKKKKIFDPTSKIFQDGGNIIFEGDLTDAEIDAYRKGGYVIEDISVPTLAKAQFGPPQSGPKPGGFIPAKSAAQVQKEELAKGQGPTRSGAQKITKAAEEYKRQEEARRRLEEAKRLKEEAARLSPASTTAVVANTPRIDIPSMSEQQAADDAYNQQMINRGYVAEAYGDGYYSQTPTVQEYFEGWRSNPEGGYSLQDIVDTEDREDLRSKLEDAQYNVWRRNEEREYQNTPWYGKALNETQAFMVDPIKHTERALEGKRSLLGQGNIDVAPEDFENARFYDRATGDRNTYAAIASEIGKIFNPMYYGAAAGQDARQGDYGSAVGNVAQGLLSGSALSKSANLKKMFDTQMFLETVKDAPETIGAWSDPESNPYANAINTALTVGFGRAGLKSLNPKAAFRQEGGKVYSYSGRPDARYMKDQSGNWLVKAKGTNNQFVPIQDPKGERAKLLNAQARPISPEVLEGENIRKVKENAQKVELNKVANLKNELKVLQNDIKNSPLSKFKPEYAESTDTGRNALSPQEAYNKKLARVKEIGTYLNQRAQSIVNYKKAQQDAEIAKKNPASPQAIQARQKWESKASGAVDPADWVWTLPIAGTSAGRAGISALSAAGNAFLDAPLLSKVPQVTLGNIGRVYTVGTSAAYAPQVYEDAKNAKTLNEKVNAGINTLATGIGLSPLVRWSNPLYNYVGTPLTFGQNAYKLANKSDDYNPATGLANTLRTMKLLTGRKEGGAYETKLTPEEIEEYRSKGYIVEELD